MLHAAAAEVLGLDWDYGRADVTATALPAFLDSLGPEWLGLSLTMPLKRAVLPLLGGHDPLVDRLGLANTVRLGPPALVNTDVGGIETVLHDLAGASTGVVLGAGATAASAVEALRRLGAGRIVVAARHPERAAADLAPVAPVGVVPLGEAPLDEADVVVSTLPGTAAAVLPVPARLDGTPLLDVAYDPWPTAVGASWLAAGGTLRHGLQLLVEQAVLQVRVFAGGDAAEPLNREAAVRAAMRASLGDVELAAGAPSGK